MIIQGEDKQSYIKIHVDKEDFMGIRFGVETQSRGMSATLGGIYMVNTDITNFVSALRTLENKRSGEACLQSAFPEELDLSIRAVNRQGHILVSLRIHDLSYYDDLMIPNSLEVCFGIDPTTLPTLLKQFERVVV